MKLKTKIKILKHKRYFDIGYGFLSYPKWVAAVFGIGNVVNKNYWTVVIGAFVFFLFCYMSGWLFVKHGWYEADIEVGNIFNLFVKEVRKKLK